MAADYVGWNLMATTVLDFGLHYHSLIFRLYCHEKRGGDFQGFFEQIMLKHDPTFICVVPSGSSGDWKCDGFSHRSGTVYQCYAPAQPTVAKYVVKLCQDFDGAKRHWQEKMKAWIFVWSASDGLPPQVLAAILALERDNPAIQVGQWSRDYLWGIVRSLTLEQRIELLGSVPLPIEAARTTANEIEVLLDFLARQPVDFALRDDLDLTAVGEKLTRNRLSEAVRAIVRTALPVARLVESYVNRHPDTEFGALIARALAAEYAAIVAEGYEESDIIFGRLIRHVAGDQQHDPKLFWAAAGIVAHYFELCEVFER
jgi:hypothetical protein